MLTLMFGFCFLFSKHGGQTESYEGNEAVNANGKDNILLN